MDRSDVSAAVGDCHLRDLRRAFARCLEEALSLDVADHVGSEAADLRVAAVRRAVAGFDVALDRFAAEWRPRRHPIVAGQPATAQPSRQPLT